MSLGMELVATLTQLQSNYKPKPDSVKSRPYNPACVDFHRLITTAPPPPLKLSSLEKQCMTEANVET